MRSYTVYFRRIASLSDKLQVVVMSHNADGALDVANARIGHLVKTADDWCWVKTTQRR